MSNATPAIVAGSWRLTPYRIDSEPAAEERGDRRAADHADEGHHRAFEQDGSEHDTLGRAERTRQLAANLAQVIEQCRTGTVRHNQLPWITTERAFAAPLYTNVTPATYSHATSSAAFRHGGL